MTDHGTYPTLQLFVDAAVVHSFRLSPGRHEIGRSDTMTIQLLDNAVSARHAVVLVSESPDFPGFYDAVIEDLGSRNGTRLNGKPVTRSDLEHGDILSLGHTQLRFAEPRDEERGNTGVVITD